MPLPSRQKAFRGSRLCCCERILLSREVTSLFACFSFPNSLNLTINETMLRCEARMCTTKIKTKRATNPRGGDLRRGRVLWIGWIKPPFNLEREKRKTTKTIFEYYSRT